MVKAGARRALFLVGAFLAGWSILALLALGAFRLYQWHPWSPTPPLDSRADPGTSRETSLNGALRQFEFRLPADAIDVHYFINGNMRGELFQLNYRIPCERASAVLAQDRLAVPIAINPSSSLQNFAERHGWRPDMGSTYVVADMRGRKSWAMVMAPPVGSCFIYLESSY
ncbi:hypothetical protein [Embleya sp. AB8]|uniref:hypothetical protein n=1 Tax=Embleya sp. AB8 TaxID=3156304 RepID=UPI003C76000B